VTNALALRAERARTLDPLLKLRFTDRLLEKEQTPAAPLCAVVLVVIIIIVVVLSLV